MDYNNPKFEQVIPWNWLFSAINAFILKLKLTRKSHSSNPQKLLYHPGAVATILAEVVLETTPYDSPRN